MYHLLEDDSATFDRYAIVDSTDCTWSYWHATIKKAISASCTHTISDFAVRDALATYDAIFTIIPPITTSTHPELFI